MDDSTVGDIMQEGRNHALKALAIFAGIIVYLGMVVYSGVHNWRLMTTGIPADMVMWAALGVIALEISAVFLPVALHWWTHAPLQRFAAFAFYFADLALIFANVVLDYAIVNGASGNLPAWLRSYQFFGVPATPVIAGIGWTLLFLLDPSQRQRGMIETLRASTREVLAARIAQAAKAADITQAVSLAAGNMARDIVSQTLGAATLRTNKAASEYTEPEYTQHARLVFDDGTEEDVEVDVIEPPEFGGNGHERPARVYNQETEAPKNRLRGV